ncbi:MAG: Smr/MutS family protein [Holosporales bacterium]|jgi:DNA-nicking Smr family endonuclease|nr:Smr/MutS family protein [Holosporales bacterium]
MKIEDVKLWKEYIKSVKQINKPNTVQSSSVASNILKNKRNPPRERESLFYENRPARLNAAANEKTSSEYSDVIILNKKNRRKFVPQAEIDLHGRTRDVDDVLETFCLRRIANGVKCVAIITGKGKGVVKQATINWLKSNPKLIVGFYEIKDSSGGSGVLGVRLKIKRFRQST